MNKARLTSILVEQILTKKADLWAANSRSRVASVIAIDGDKCVELRVKRTPPELVSELCEETPETAELFFWIGPQAVKLPLSARIHARAVELWKSIGMSPKDIEKARSSCSLSV